MQSNRAIAVTSALVVVLIAIGLLGRDFFLGKKTPQQSAADTQNQSWPRESYVKECPEHETKTVEIRFGSQQTRVSCAAVRGSARTNENGSYATVRMWLLYSEAEGVRPFPASGEEMQPSSNISTMQTVVTAIPAGADELDRLKAHAERQRAALRVAESNVVDRDAERRVYVASQATAGAVVVLQSMSEPDGTPVIVGCDSTAAEVAKYLRTPPEEFDPSVTCRIEVDLGERVLASSTVTEARAFLANLPSSAKVFVDHLHISGFGKQRH